MNLVRHINLLISLGLCCVMSGSCLPGEEIPDSGRKPDNGGQPEVPENIMTAVFRPGERGYAYFRIPASVVSQEGTIMVFAEGRVDNSEDYGNIDIVLKRSFDGGKSWDELCVVADDSGNRCGNPVPVVLESGKILLVYSWSKTGEEATVNDVVYTVFSEDDGKTWSSPVDITSQIKGNGDSNFHSGPVHGIVKTFEPHKGRIIVPMWGSSPKAFVIYSDDDGLSWHKGGAASYEKSNESTVAELGNGDIIMNSRNGDKSNYYRYDAVSEDGGETFLPSRQTSLIEPVNGCQGSLLRHSVGPQTKETVLLFCNPNHTSSRRHGTIKASFDSGKIWSKMYQFVPSEGDGMYTSYSDMVLLSETVIGVVYEAGFKNGGGLVFKTVKYSDLK